jgi:hypothetical protein
LIIDLVHYQERETVLVLLTELRFKAHPLNGFSCPLTDYWWMGSTHLHRCVLFQQKVLKHQSKWLQ